MLRCNDLRDDTEVCEEEEEEAVDGLEDTVTARCAGEMTGTVDGLVESRFKSDFN